MLSSVGVCVGEQGVGERRNGSVLSVSIRWMICYKSRMIRKKIRTILLALALLVAAVVPAGAEERTFELNIPGCTA